MTEHATVAGERTATWADGLLLGAGTFLAVPVPPPAVVDRRAGAMALLSAPLWGALVGLAAGMGGGALWWLAEASGNNAAGVAFVVATGVYALTALITRGLHLDGLADTADGLGSGRTGPAGLAVMRQPAVGAFAVVALIATAGSQVTAMATIFARHGAIVGVVAVIAAALVARAPLSWLARAGTPADDSGLGRTVVGSVDPRVAFVAGVCWSSAAAGLLLVGGVPWPAALVVAAVSWLPSLWLRRRALGRFGALTGDVLGAAVEASTTVALVLVALVG